MFIALVEFFLICALSIAMFGFEGYARLIICLYYARKIILWFVGSKIV